MITQNRLKQILHYSPDTGVFTFKKNISRKIKAGDVAGTIKHHGYVGIGCDRITYWAHRLAFLYMVGYFPENMVDHINTDKSDNRWDNLREVSHVCNLRNTGNQINTKSGVKGVIKKKQPGRRDRWYIQIGFNKEAHYLGSSACLLEAACHRLAAEQCLNWENCGYLSPAYKYVKSHIPTIM